LGPTAFPWGTLAINVVGSFLIGVFAVVLLGNMSERVQGLYLLFGTGFCGGLTTFSTFEWELLRLVRERAYAAAAAYVVASVMLGLLAVLAGAAWAARWK
jgi:CrcB protein